jgi:RHS repeat-associated protein
LGSGAFPLALTRYYNSLNPRDGSFGNNWRGYYDRSVVVTSTTLKGKTTTVAEALRHDGRVLKFALTNGAWVGEPDLVDRLENLPGGGYRFVCGSDQVEQYGSTGKLISVAAREGFAQALDYDAQGRLSQVTDAFGRKLAFGYDAANRVTAMTDPAGKGYTYAYSANGNLAAVQYPDLKQRQYHYENGSFPRALTGITDENQVRYASFSYDAIGRAVQSALAGGAKLASISYYANGTRDVADATGVSRRYGFSVIQGVARRTSVDDGACASCGSAGTSITSTAYNSSGFVTGITDYRGTQFAFTRDQRGLETSRTEAVDSSEQRTIATTWHSSWRLPLSVSRAGRTTVFTYDGAGRVLTRTETDAATNSEKRWTFTYNGQGLLATVDGPRTDVSDVTTYMYDAQANLSTVTNALGQMTRFTSHDPHGRVLSMTDPNGLVTTFAYDLRGRLLTSNEGGLVTSFTYTASGQLLRRTRPDGSWVEMQYDGAQQLIGLIDSAGQRVAYTLDGNGRPTREEHFDSLGTSVFQRGWSYDTMGRVIHEIDAQGTTQWQHGYDRNGNRTASMDAFGQRTLRSYDALDRLLTSSDPTSATTTYSYDARDNLVRVVDPRGVVTQYSRDGLDNMTQESSADAGVSNFSYDAAGNLKTRTWANGMAVSFTLDALNRVTLEDYGSGVQVAYSYDIGVNGIGHLGGSIDAAGSNTWSYDVWGHTVALQRTTGTRVLTTTYGYDSVGRLAALGHPSGRSVTYGFDAAGRVSGIAVDGQAIVSAVAWHPFGAMKGWTQSNGRVVARTFDRDGRLRVHSFDTGTRSLNYDLKGRITQISEPWGNRDFAYDAADRLTAETTWGGNWSYVWDGNGNRLSQTSPWGNTTFSYQAGSNRVTSASGQFARAFSHDAAGNTTSEGDFSYVYDARNRLASAAGATHAYDAMGRRVMKSSGSNRYYAHDEQRKIIGEYDDAGSLGETIWMGSTPVAFLRAGQTYWIDADHIDAPRALRNVGDQIVWRWRSDAFGSQAAEEDPSGLGPFEFNHRLPGQMFDRETGLHHNDQRDYRALVGRYVQSDPIGLAGGINTYAYVGGNPVSWVDPNGLMGQGAGASGARSVYAPGQGPGQGFGGFVSGLGNAFYNGMNRIDRSLSSIGNGPLPAGTGQCVTAECAAGLLPAPSDNRTQAQIDVGICTLVCNISAAGPVAACNAAAGGGLVGGVAATTTRMSVCSMVCKP